MQAHAKKISTGCATIRGSLTAQWKSLRRLHADCHPGPKGVNVLQKLTDADLNTVKFYWVTHGTVCGLKNILIARTGYTAEDGFEIYIPADEATSARVWNEILGAGKEFGLVPCGLGSRNTLRLEGKLPLYGHEISDTINVWEAGLDRFCKMEKTEFVGRAALEKAKAAGVKRTLAGLEMTERGIARDGYRVWDDGGREIGYVTSGSPAPFLKKNLALAYVPPDSAAVGTVVRVEIRGLGVAAQVVRLRFISDRRKLDHEGHEVTRREARRHHGVSNRSQIHEAARVDSSERVHRYRGHNRPCSRVSRRHRIRRIAQGGGGTRGWQAVWNCRVRESGLGLVRPRFRDRDRGERNPGYVSRGG